MVAMSKQTLLCFLCVILSGVVVNANRPQGNSQNGRPQVRSISRSHSASSVGHSTSSSSSYASYSSSSSSGHSESTTPVSCQEDNCGRNSTYKKCPNPCPGTCGNPNGVPNCYRMCKEYGCECNTGYVVSENDTCVKLEDCPDYLRCNDRNATFKQCPTPCPGTCAFPGPGPCNKACVKEGCECKQGFYLNDVRKCVELKDCPEAKTCSVNETFVFCAVGCPNNYCPKDDNRGIIACSPPYPCKSGCACKGDYLRSPETQECVLYSDCSPIKCTRPNEVYSARPPPCLFDRCTDIGKPQQCNRNYPNRPQCVCKPGFYRDLNDMCVPEAKCPKPPPKCGLNEVAVYCKTQCPPQSCNITYVEYICLRNITCEPGCDCKENYLRNDKGICIPRDKCPPPPVLPKCGENEDISLCKIVCPPQTCESIFTTYFCPENSTCEWGCDCKDGFLRNIRGECIPSDKCFENNCGRNSTYKKCPNPCPGTCGNPNGVPNCYRMCKEYGCECNTGYVVSENDTCVKLEDCPDYLRCNDRNATFKQCPRPCPGTCAFPGPGPCNKACVKEGCECKQGFYLNDVSKCVELKDCPEAKTCSVNETFVFCAVGCPNNYCPKDDNRGIIACSPPYPCKSGCACKGDYLRSPETQECVLYSDCSPIKCTRPNEVYSARPPPCLFDRCTDIGKPHQCDRNYPNRPQCVCKPGFYRDLNDMCVPEAKCPKPPPKCGLNEVAVDCKTQCPPQSCNITYVEYICLRNITCEPGCDCKENYLRNDKGICIPRDKCPPRPVMPKCGENEDISLCKIVCPPQTCESIFTTYFCPENSTCEWGCDCKEGYLRNARGECIPSDKCFEKCDIKPECRPTCANPEPNCLLVDLPTNVLENRDGCKCQPGYILSDTNGACISIDKCPDTGCKGDQNATTTACPWPCPSTCKSPNAGSYGHKCDAVGCQCKPGLILSDDGGKCILPDECECGNPCGANGTFSECGFRCPNQYCPEDDSLIKTACKPGRPCPPGCQCKPNYLRKSYDDDTCVLASDCTPVTCTRPNEVWNPCASECLAESCDDLTTKQECYSDPENCRPQCVCRKGYYRNQSGTCVCKAECPNNCKVQQECRPTCAVPNPKNCPFIPSAEVNEDSCNCQAGYVLSAVGGTCIKIENCPTNQTCNGDANAIIKECPLPCPSTCESPNATPCKRKCDLIGCECKPGYLKSETGQCILPDQCKGGNPCGENENFVACRFQCPTNYCPTDDSRALIVCEFSPFAPCFSGCSCKLNHKRRSTEDPRCIVSSDCPAVNCTRQNEEWSPCPSECTSDYCDAVNAPRTVCNTFVLNCNPKCVCRKSYFRNDNDLCVSSDECRCLNMKKKKQSQGN